MSADTKCYNCIFWSLPDVKAEWGECKNERYRKERKATIQMTRPEYGCPFFESLSALRRSIKQAASNG